MFRSASGPAGLSINTGTANSLFGSNTPAQSTGTGFGTATAQQQQQQPQNTGSLFGAPTPASGGLFGGGTTTSQQQQQQQTPNLFGQPAQQQPQQQQAFGGGGIFGQPQQQAQQQQTGGTFGQPQQQQPSGGIFGQPAQQQQQQAQQQQQMSLFGGGTTTTPAATGGGGLFGGGATTQQQPAQNTGTSLFGGGAAQPAQQQTTGTSLFGTAQPAQQQNTGTTSLFGQPQQQQQQQQQQQPAQQQPAQQQQTASLFGGTGGAFLFGTTKPATTTLGGTSFGTTQPSTTSTQQQPTSTGLSLSMGQNTTTQQQQSAGSKIDLAALRSTTRFSDLTDSLQAQLTQIDDSIQKCISDCSAINAFLPGHESQLSSIPVDVSFVSRKSEGAAGALNSDVLAIASLKETVKKDAANAKLSFKSIDQLRLPGGIGRLVFGLLLRLVVLRGLSSTGQKTGQQEDEEAEAESNQDLLGYFSKTADEMDEMMKRFERNLGEIEVHLHGVQGNVLEQLQRAAFGQQKQLAQGGGQDSAMNGDGQVDHRVVELAGVLRDFEESILKVAGVVGGVKEGITELQLRDFMGHGS
ncbi:unnamed protein product [Sordaria macrospora k-hell]|uniref:WGS project CABT00000000 data, contig 2.62 n=1 Tax=Sordaria macrospora (strain ATCC MYA-333 / DSM 997 / K(L3346) / K-hell) TaxID=771870 RepID=F7WAK2_SORMK|nr:uncharacterized protein SMAC_09052 [Sordaria macrospora k-hell]CCC14196.1 unnamed protein product [Sordaria macrospora k-hell]